MKISPFQAVVLAIFSVAIVGGVIVLSLQKSSSQGSGIPVVIWGTLSQEHFGLAVSEVTQGNKGMKITYVEKRAETFNQELIEALASGIGPDVILLPQDLIMRFRNKILPMPYTTLLLRTFTDSFIQEGGLYLDSNGILAVPFVVDPLVMYWNRDILTNAGLALPPKTWDEFITLVPKLTVKDKNVNILKSAVALGEFRNIINAKEIIATLFLQTGNAIMGQTANGLESTLSPASLSSIGAINFYTDFANPVKPDYSWNRALPNSRDMFIAGDLAFYFGFTSEIGKIRDKNPNLNFDVTYFPQPKGSQVAVTFGRMQGLAVMRNSSNSVDAFNDILTLTSPAVLERLSQATGLPSVRLDMLGSSADNPYQAIFNSSAIRARGWLDPNPLSSGLIFQNMIESVTGGELEVGKAIDTAGRNLESASQGL